MKKNIKNLICFGIIATAFSVPVITIASTTTDNGVDVSEAKEGLAELNISDPNGKYSQEELDRMYKENYDNDYYRDIFNNLVAKNDNLILSTKTIPIINIPNTVELNEININQDYIFPATFSEKLTNLSDINVIYTNEGLPVFFLQGAYSSLDNSLQKSNNTLSSTLAAIIQASYSKNSSFLIDCDLNETDKAYATALAIYITENNISIQSLIDGSTPTDENFDRWTSIINYIKSLINNNYKKGYIDIDFSDKMIESEYYIETDLNQISTNYDNIYLDIYDDKGYVDVLSLNCSSTDSQLDNSYHNGDTFKCAIDKNSLINKKNLLYSMNEDESLYPTMRFNPELNDLKVIYSGEDITLNTYYYNNTICYIPYYDSNVFLYDVDMHPEQYSNIYKYYNINLNVIGDGNDILDKSVYLLKKNSETNTYEICQNMILSTNDNIKFPKLVSGEYKIIIPEDDHFYASETNISIGTDNSILDVKKEYDVDIELHPISDTRIQLVNIDTGEILSNESIEICKYDNSESYKYLTDKDGFFTFDKASVGFYDVVIEKDNNRYLCTFEVGNSDAYYKVMNNRIVNFSFGITNPDNTITDDSISSIDSYNNIDKLLFGEDLDIEPFAYNPDINSSLSENTSNIIVKEEDNNTLNTENNSSNYYISNEPSDENQQSTDYYIATDESLSNNDYTSSNYYEN